MRIRVYTVTVYTRETNHRGLEAMFKLADLDMSGCQVGQTRRTKRDDAAGCLTWMSSSHRPVLGGRGV